jgi:hypothetical protein
MKKNTAPIVNKAVDIQVYADTTPNKISCIGCIRLELFGGKEWNRSQ